MRIGMDELWHEVYCYACECSYDCDCGDASNHPDELCERCKNDIESAIDNK